MALEISIKKKIGKFVLDVNLNGEFKEHIGILGASGCGKSMTLKCIAGIEKPDFGRIVLNGTVLFDSEKRINLPPQKRKIGYLFQNYALFPNMTVKENIKIGMLHIKDNNQKQQKISQLIEKFHLIGLEDRYPYQLSGGQQQRVALARILANEPDIIMLDEPFSALDSFLKEELQREMKNTLSDYDCIVIMVSHNRDEIFKLTEKLAIMDMGKVITYRNTKDIFDNPEYLEAARLTGCKNISRAEKVGDFEIHAIDWNISLHTAKPVSEDIGYVGIRAHHINVFNEESDVNRFAVHTVQVEDMPFDINYIVKNVIGSSQEIWIKIAKTELACKEFQYINSITMMPENLLLLR